MLIMRELGRVFGDNSHVCRLCMRNVHVAEAKSIALVVGADAARSVVTPTQSNPGNEDANQLEPVAGFQN